MKIEMDGLMKGSPAYEAVVKLVDAIEGWTEDRVPKDAAETKLLSAAQEYLDPATSQTAR